MTTATARVVDGACLRVRPVTVADLDRLVAGFDRLSAESRYRRFLGPKPALSGAELTYLTDIDHRTHAAFAAVDERDGSFLGIARYAVSPGEPESTTADISVVGALGSGRCRSAAAWSTSSSSSTRSLRRARARRAARWGRGRRR